MNCFVGKVYVERALELTVVLSGCRRTNDRLGRCGEEDDGVVCRGYPANAGDG